MLEWIFDTDRSLGMGLMHLSLIVDSKQPTKITIIKPWNDEHTTIFELVKIFSLSQRFPIELTLEHNPGQELIERKNSSSNLANIFTDMTKIISPYFSSDTINVLGRTWDIDYKNRLDKRYIGIANNIYLRDDELPLLNSNVMPYCRFYTRAQWCKIADLLMSYGYEVMFIQSGTIEEKVYLLNQHCAAVIGYEGGVCQLSHLLKIPTIVLPWHHGPDGKVDYPDLKYQAHRFQVDPYTWFPTSLSELLNLSQSEFQRKIIDLAVGEGNNIFLDSNTEFLWDHSSRHSNLPVKNEHFGVVTEVHLSQQEREFIETYCRKQ